MKQLGFGCELETDELQDLFDDPAVLETLAKLDAGVALSITDLSDERAAVVRRLNEAGIPLGAWLVLPRADGYWFHAGNAPQATARYAAFKAWTARHELEWEGIGLDIEPDMNEIQRLRGQGRWPTVRLMLRRAFDHYRLAHAERAYATLVAQIRADGYRVETFQFPFMVDERKAGSALLQRMLGLVDLKADRELLMLYSTFAPPIGDGMLWSYAPEAEGVIVGITGPGVEPEGSLVPLTWDLFARDLRLAAHWHDEVFIYSLEGCVRQGFLERLVDFDWEAPFEPPVRTTRQVNAARKALQAVLWAGARPSLLLAGALGVVQVASWLCRLGGRRRVPATTGG
ncbi:MAG: hypothetical protein P8129_14935 [Anaerolineae bacterium]